VNDQLDLFPAVHHIVGLSGGKDSTAMALRLKELHPDTAYEFVCTPTGNELPEMRAHWTNLERILGQPLIHANAGVSLVGLIAQQKAIPNWRMRWCTRKLKIEPFQAYVLGHLPAVTYVGIRADEAGAREGVTDWGSTDVRASFPLVEWGWNLGDVVDYLKANEVEIPKRTDCGLCFFQTLGEWHRLWSEHPALYAQGETLEGWTGHTFRSPQRDSRPAALADLRVLFERGYTPKPRTMDDRKLMCSVCAR
jgi:3'-phosphoadenosine 5'-phosphosulfate sulfotransferase (PAPS reductase)/FAD synthetase